MFLYLYDRIIASSLPINLPWNLEWPVSLSVSDAMHAGKEYNSLLPNVKDRNNLMVLETCAHGLLLGIANSRGLLSLSYVW